MNITVLRLAKLKKKKSIIIFSLFVIILAVIAFFIFFNKETTLDFKVMDSVSKKWVWEATIKFQDKVIESYFQSDHEPAELIFTKLKSGNYELSVEAPYYESFSKTVNIKPGKNVLDEPILMKGLEIPSLDRVVVTEEWLNRDLFIELRLENTSGNTIINHPCIDIKVAAIIYEQLKDGMYVMTKEQRGSERGKILYKDWIDWSWDSTPETTFRYKGLLPGGRIEKSQTNYYVIDYFIIVPKPDFVGSEEYDSVIEEISRVKNIDEVLNILNNEKNKVKYFIDSSWGIARAI